MRIGGVLDSLVDPRITSMCSSLTGLLFKVFWSLADKNRINDGLDGV